MTVLVYQRRRYRYIRMGCPSLDECRNGVQATTVIRLNRDGTDAYTLTECVPFDQCTVEDTCTTTT